MSQKLTGVLCLQQGGVEVKAGQGHARDMFALGVFIELLSEQLTELGQFVSHT